MVMDRETQFPKTIEVVIANPDQGRGLPIKSTQMRVCDLLQHDLPSHH